MSARNHGEQVFAPLNARSGGEPSLLGGKFVLRRAGYSIAVFCNDPKRLVTRKGRQNRQGAVKIRGGVGKLQAREEVKHG